MADTATSAAAEAKKAADEAAAKTVAAEEASVKKAAEEAAAKKAAEEATAKKAADEAAAKKAVVEAPKDFVAPAVTSSAATVPSSDGPTGGRVLPKEEISDDVRAFLKTLK